MAQVRVAEGDTLWAIAERNLGDGARWRELYDANRQTIGPDPNRIQPGMTLTIPGDDPGAPAASPTGGSGTPPEEPTGPATTPGGQPRSRRRFEPTEPAPLPGRRPFEPPETEEPSEEPSEAIRGGPSGQPLDQLGPTAKAEMRRILGRRGLGGLADIAWEFMRAGVTDPQQLLMELEGTEEFRRIFAGIRDPETDQLIMTPARYMDFKEGVREQLFAFGVNPERHGFSVDELTAAFVQQRRTLENVQKDLEAMAELESRPELRRQFFAYAGVDPGTEGLFALALDLPQAEDLRQAFDQAVEQGVSTEEFFDRLRTPLPSGPVKGQDGNEDVLAQDIVTDPLTGEGVSRRELRARYGTTNPDDVRERRRRSGEGATPTNLTDENEEPLSLEELTAAITPGEGFELPEAIGGVGRLEKVRALRRAELAERSFFERGGERVTQQQRRQRTF